MGRDSELLPGVRELDHTADLAIELTAPDLGELFHRAALGMFQLIRDTKRPQPDPDRERVVSLKAEDPAELLVKWLRELLYFHEVDGEVYRSARFEELGEDRLLARVRLGREREDPIREVKGVTYHRLRAAKEDGGWRARVIFDV